MVGCLQYWTYSVNDALPQEVVEAKKVKLQVSHYVIINNELFRRVVSRPLWKCIHEDHTMYVLDKVHREICEMHIRRRNMEIRVIRAGYYWPTLRTDCTKYVKKCKGCQEFSNTHYAPPKELHNITSPWPFTMWGMDILMPFPTTKSQIKFLLTELRKKSVKDTQGVVGRWTPEHALAIPLYSPIYHIGDTI